MTAGSSAVAFEDVTVVYTTDGGSVHVLDQVSFEASPSSFVSIIGPSGCGKSTLLKVAAGVVKPTGGSAYLEGQEPQLVNGSLGRSLGFVFQRPLLLPWRSSIENVLLPIEFMRRGKANDDDRRRALSLLELTGLEDFADRFPHQLSGGMQQRVSLCRALIVEPRVLLMDEPFSALDEITREQLQDELLRIFSATDLTVLFVTHNVDEAVLLSDEVIVMSPRPGRVITRHIVKLSSDKTTRRRGDEAITAEAQVVRRILREHL